MIEDWEIEIDLGYTFEFVSKKHPGVMIRIAASSEQKAWEKLKRVVK